MGPDPVLFRPDSPRTHPDYVLRRLSENTQPSPRRTPNCLALLSLRDSWGMLGWTSGRVRIAVFQTGDADSPRCRGLPRDACDSVRRAGHLRGSSVNHATTPQRSVWLRGCVVRSQGACFYSRGSYGNSRFLFSLLATALLSDSYPLKSDSLDQPTPNARSHAFPKTRPLPVNHATANHAITTQIPAPSYALTQTPTPGDNHATTSYDHGHAGAQCNGIDPQLTESPTTQPRPPHARLAVGSQKG